eukprot:1946929-Prymnesium_polylepis.1
MYDYTASAAHWTGVTSYGWALPRPRRRWRGLRLSVPNARQRATFAWSRQGSVPSRSRASVSAAVGSDATTQAKARPKKTQAQLNKERHERENAGIRVVVLKACGRRGNGCKADTETELSNSALLDTSVLAVSVEVCRLPLPIGPL